jgi:hypothetical protein
MTPNRVGNPLGDAELAAVQHALDFALEQREELEGEIELLRQENNMLFDRAAHRLAELKEALARVAELEAALAEARDKPKRGAVTIAPGVSEGLIKGRVRLSIAQPPAKGHPVFHDALQMATKDDLMWALNLLIRHPNAKRTWRNYRIQQIDKRLREIMQERPS